MDIWIIFVFLAAVLFLFPRILRVVAAIYYILLPENQTKNHTKLSLKDFKKLKKEHIKL